MNIRRTKIKILEKAERNAEYTSALVDCVIVPGKKYDEMVDEIKEFRDLEKSYSRRLGELARLCDVVCPWVLDQDKRVAVSNVVPASVISAADEIMEFVNCVRP